VRRSRLPQLSQLLGNQRQLVAEIEFDLHQLDKQEAAAKQAAQQRGTLAATAGSATPGRNRQSLGAPAAKMTPEAFGTPRLRSVAKRSAPDEAQRSPSAAQPRMLSFVQE
jgi:hypothetical protein